MLAAIEEFSRLHNKANNYMILGDMFELGADAEAEHLKTVTLANAVFNGIKIWVGPEFCAAATQYDDTNNLGFTTTDEATEWITNQPIANAVILLKGSRSMGLEKIIKKIKSL
jgi:UDP-N-acetylmuramoyl-tripeptide--D-alanyl-D-alanine ligase